MHGMELIGNYMIWNDSFFQVSIMYGLQTLVHDLTPLVG
jgi:hypothetical protein